MLKSSYPKLLRNSAQVDLIPCKPSSNPGELFYLLFISSNQAMNKRPLALYINLDLIKLDLWTRSVLIY